MEDMETCSICTSEVPVTDLKSHTFNSGDMSDTWEMVCSECRAS